VSPLLSAGREDGSQSLVSKFEEETFTSVDVNADFLGTGSQVHPRKLAENPWTQFGEDIDGEAAGDLSGISLAMTSDGKRVVIGAPGNGNAAGHVRVYDLTGSAPTQIGGDIDGDAADDQSGASVAISKDGTRVVIGAITNNGRGGSLFGSGHARVFQFNGNAWIKLGEDIDGDALLDFSGISVAITQDGSRVVIGAVFNRDGAGSGYVRVFDFDVDDVKWNQIGGDLDLEEAREQSGVRSVAISSDGLRVVTGASVVTDVSGEGQVDNISDLGYVRVFDLDGTTWSQTGQDIDGEAVGDAFGVSVALSANGNRVAIGAFGNDGDDGDAPNSGRARVFQFIGAMWIQIGQDIDGEATGDASGVSVDLSADGNRVAIGAFGNDGNGRNSGQARVLDLDLNVAVNVATWIQIGQDIDGEATGDQSGIAVALSANGNRIVIGAFLNDGSKGEDSGQVRVFDYVVCSAFLFVCMPKRGLTMHLSHVLPRLLLLYSSNS
jgi:hypothetical protein